MNSEICKHCGLVESAHTIRADIEADPSYSLEKCTEKLTQAFKGESLPCEEFTSEIVHLPGCPIVIDYYGTSGRRKDIYCQDLDGGCEKLIRIQKCSEEP